MGISVRIDLVSLCLEGILLVWFQEMDHGFHLLEQRYEIFGAPTRVAVDYLPIIVVRSGRACIHDHCKSQ